MFISKRFKEKAKGAKSKGYRNIYSIGGSYKDTTYVTFWNIDDLLKKPEGSSVRAFRASSQCRWHGCSSTRHINPQTDISYGAVMQNY